MASDGAKKTKRMENPLMPDERLRQMYTAMMQVELLEERLQGRKRKGTAERVGVEVAARAATVLSLGTGDLISDVAEAAGMDLLLGVTLSVLLRATETRVKKEPKPTEESAFAVRLPVVKRFGEQIEMAIGAGAALKAQRGGRVVLAFLRREEIQKKALKRALQAAGRSDLPILFAVLPGDEGSFREGEISAKSGGWGVPGFPVDGGDAIALYRVMQESLLRGRADGSPALMECLLPDADRKGGAKGNGATERLRSMLLEKGVVDEAWVEMTRAAFVRRMEKVAPGRAAGAKRG